MRVKVLGAAGGEAPGHQLTGFLIDDEILLDAGTISRELDLAQQRRIKYVLITHAHLDHVHALPFLLDNLIGRVEQPVMLFGHPEVLQTIHAHIFNGRIWPDFTQLPTPAQPILRMAPMVPGQSLAINGYTIEPVLVRHSFAAYAYIISDGRGSIVFTGDTAPVPELWARIGQLPKVYAAFSECSFSNHWQDLARMTSHLCPADIAAALAATGRGPEIPVYLYHIKPDYLQEIAIEIQALRPLQVAIARTGEEYDFSQ